MTQGVVKWFNSRKGYGFAKQGQNLSFYFLKPFIVNFYWGNVPETEGSFKTLYQGERVEFELVDGDKGQEARDVKVTEKSSIREKYNKSQMVQFKTVSMFEISL